MMTDTPYWISSVDSTASRSLTLNDIEQAIESIHEGQLRDTQVRIARTMAWSALVLDYDAMTEAERLWCAIGEESDAVHPDHARIIDAIVQKYRRDR